MNDLHEATSLPTVLYVDNTSVVGKGNNLQQ